MLLSNWLWFSSTPSVISSLSWTISPELAYSDLFPSDCNLPKPLQVLWCFLFLITFFYLPPLSSPPLCFLAWSFFVFFSFFSPVHYMKKLEGSTPCTVMVCVNGPAVRTSVRTLDSFWSKNMHCDTDVILEMVSALLSLLILCVVLYVCFCTRGWYLFYWKTCTSYPLHYSTSSLWIQRSEQRKHHCLSNSTFWPSRQPIDRVQL